MIFGWWDKPSSWTISGTHANSPSSYHKRTFKKWVNWERPMLDHKAPLCRRRYACMGTVYLPSGTVSDEMDLVPYTAGLSHPRQGTFDVACIDSAPRHHRRCPSTLWYLARDSPKNRVT